MDSGKSPVDKGWEVLPLGRFWNLSCHLLHFAKKHAVHQFWLLSRKFMVNEGAIASCPFLPFTQLFLSSGANLCFVCLEVVINEVFKVVTGLINNQHVADGCLW